MANTGPPYIPERTKSAPNNDNPITFPPVFSSSQLPVKPKAQRPYKGDDGNDGEEQTPQGSGAHKKLTVMKTETTQKNESGGAIQKKTTYKLGGIYRPKKKQESPAPNPATPTTTPAPNPETPTTSVITELPSGVQIKIPEPPQKPHPKITITRTEEKKEEEDDIEEEPSNPEDEWSTVHANGKQKVNKTHHRKTSSGKHGLVTKKSTQKPKRKSIDEKPKQKNIDEKPKDVVVKPISKDDKETLKQKDIEEKQNESDVHPESNKNIIEKSSSSVYIPPSLQSTTSKPREKRIYEINEMKSYRDKKIRPRDKILEEFEKLIPKKTVKEHKSDIVVDQRKAVYKQSFNRLTSLTIDEIAKELFYQIRTADDMELMISILFSNAINERKYVAIYVKFLLRLRELLQTKEEKHVLGAEMTKILLNKAEKKFENPPVKIQPKPNETPEERVQREEQENIEEHEYIGTVFLVSHLYTEKIVLNALVLQCLKILSQKEGKIPIKAFTTLVKETHVCLANDDVSFTEILGWTHQLLSKNITFMEKVWLENSITQLTSVNKPKKEEKNTQHKSTGVELIELFTKGDIKENELVKKLPEKSDQEIALSIEEAMNVMDNRNEKHLCTIITGELFVSIIGGRWENILNRMEKYLYNEFGGFELLGQLLGIIYGLGYVELRLILEMIEKTVDERFSIVGKIQSPLFLLGKMVLTVVLNGNVNVKQLRSDFENNENILSRITDHKSFTSELYKCSLVMASGSENDIGVDLIQSTIDRAGVLVDFVGVNTAIDVVKSLWKEGGPATKQAQDKILSMLNSK
ncbi:DNA double-strand break repair Rad50 ATPase [Entamoeba marina]